MFISKIEIENYRGIKNKEVLELSKFTSIIGKNDSGKSIILNAIATFLDIKNFPITLNDFNDISKPIIFKFTFHSEYIKEVLLEYFETKLKKDSGLEDFINSIIDGNKLKIIKKINKAGKQFSYEKLIIQDFEEKEFSRLYEKSEKELLHLIKKYNIKVPIEGKGKNSKIEKIKYIREFCQNNNFKKLEKEIDDEYKILSLLPSVELFEADYGLKADTSFKNQIVSEIMYFFKNNYNVPRNSDNKFSIYFSV